MTEQQLIDEGYKDGQKSFEFLFKKIYDHFDWERVYKAMRALDWVWHFGNERYGIPNIKTIQQSAMDLLKGVYDRGTGMSSTGGFSAGWDDGHLWLSFGVAEAHTCDL